LSVFFSEKKVPITSEVTTEKPSTQYSTSGLHIQPLSHYHSRSKVKMAVKIEEFFLFLLAVKEDRE